MTSGIHITSSQVIIKKDYGSNKQSLPKFQNNEILKAKILQLLPNGKTLIEVNNQKIVAKAAMLLNPGEEVQLKVVSQKDAYVLKLINTDLNPILNHVQKMTTRQISSLVNLFTKNDPILGITEKTTAKIKDLFYDIALKSAKADKTFLPRLIDKSGISLENKIANIISDKNLKQNIKVVVNTLLKQDIKGNILQEFLSMDSQNPKATESMKMVTSFLETMENFQLLNHQSSDSGRFLLPFPIFSDSAFDFGQLFIETGDKKSKNKNQDGEKVTNISFLLNMTQLGPLRADFSILKKEITGRFLLQDEDTCDYVKSMVHQLKARLAKVEYHALNIECKIAKKAELQPGVFIESLVKANDDTILNIII